jgi:phosphocarrier protein
MTEVRHTREVEIVNALGLHARAASRLVALARRYRADIRVRCGERRVDGKSVVSLLTLAGSRGKRIFISADGEDAEDALEALCTLVAGGLGEGPAEG